MVDIYGVMKGKYQLKVNSNIEHFVLHFHVEKLVAGCHIYGLNVASSLVNLKSDGAQFQLILNLIIF